MVISGTSSATKPYPGSDAGSRRHQAAPIGPDASSAITPRSPARPHERRYLAQWGSASASWGVGFGSIHGG